MRKAVSNIQSLAVVMDRRDSSKLVSTNIEYREGRSIVRRTKGPLDRVEVRKFPRFDANRNRLALDDWIDPGTPTDETVAAKT